MNNLQRFKIPFITFLVVYFLFLVISRAPAGWFTWALHQSVPTLWLSSAEGTIWKGKAKSAQLDINRVVMPLGNVEWRLKPLSLLTFRPCVVFSATLPKQSISGEVCKTSTGGTISNANIDAPLSVFKDVINVDATGLVSLQVISADITQELAINELDARLSWQNARINIGDTWLTLGDFASKLKENDAQGIEAEIFDINSPYKSDLVGTWHKQNEWKVAGTVAPKGGASDMVMQGLEMLGEDMGEGVYKVQWPL